jgi:hypothetical protein
LLGRDADVLAYNRAFHSGLAESSPTVERALVAADWKPFC